VYWLAWRKNVGSPVWILIKPIKVTLVDYGQRRFAQPWWPISAWQRVLTYQVIFYGTTGSGKTRLLGVSGCTRRGGDWTRKHSATTAALF
jgi:hypothetical protein